MCATSFPDQKVLIDGIPRSVGWLFATVAGQQLLETAYGPDGAVIQCTCTNELLQLHPYRALDGAIRLRCDNLTGPRHATDCFRHGEITPYRQRAIRFQQAVRLDENTNIYTVSLSCSLELRPSSDAKQKRPKTPGKDNPEPDGVRGKISLATYLKFLIQTSGQHGNLAANFPEFAVDFCRGLALSSSSNVVNGLPGQSVVLAAGVDNLQEHPRLNVGIRARRFAIAVGAIAAGKGLYKQMGNFGDGMIAIPLEGLRQPLLVHSSEWEKIVDRSGFPYARAAASRLVRRSDSLYGILAARVFRGGKGALRIADGALRFAAPNFMPVDSRLEADVAMALTDAGRVFAKPLIYRPADLCLPDFVLYDTDPITIIEVRGMSTPIYMNRFDAKLDMLRKMTSAHILVVDAVRNGELMCRGNIVALPQPSWASVQRNYQRVHGLDWGLRTVLENSK